MCCIYIYIYTHMHTSMCINVCMCLFICLSELLLCMHLHIHTPGSDAPKSIQIHRGPNNCQYHFEICVGHMVL